VGSGQREIPLRPATITVTDAGGSFHALDNGSSAFHPEGEEMPSMYAVIFEVQPNEGHRQEYLDIAAGLRPLLEQVDGFISVERFESLTEPGKILSLSFWRDEQAVETWRRNETHRTAQTTGRASVFKHYRLRVANVVRDYGMLDREQAPEDSTRIHG
jgi:heme-degrading monooxygenase HmoA